MAFQKSSGESHGQTLQNVESESERDDTTMSDGKEIKNLFNLQVKNGVIFSPQVDLFVYSAEPMDLAVVLINFSAIEHNGDKETLIPGEMALSAFSIRDGIVDNCAVYINHGNQISETATRGLNNVLDLPTVKETEPNYKHAIWILNQFRMKHRFGKRVNQHALLFCRKSEFERTSASLDYLYKAYGAGEFAYKLFPLEYLLSCLHFKITQESSNQTKKHFLSDKEASDILDSGDYTNFDQMLCLHHYHNKRRSEYCPLKTVNMHAYIIIAAFMDTKTASPGSHYPTTAHRAQEALRRGNQLLEWHTNSLDIQSVPIPTTGETREDSVGSNNASEPKPGNQEPLLLVENLPLFAPNPSQDIPTGNNQQFFTATQQAFNYGWTPYTVIPEFYPPPPQPSFHGIPYVPQWPGMGYYPYSPFPINHAPVFPSMSFDFNAYHRALNPSSQMGNNPMQFFVGSSIQDPRMQHYPNYPNFPFTPPLQNQKYSLMPGEQNQNNDRSGGI